jgi:4-alpha-glucanotransferase
MDAAGDLRARAGALGVATGYSDGRGQWHEVSDATLEAVLTAIAGEDELDPRWPPAVVAHLGRVHEWAPVEDTSVHLVLESGEEHPVPATLPAELPPGYHRVVGHTGSTTLVVAPPTCYLPDRLAGGGRATGWAAQVYSLHSETSWGIGDLDDLATLSSDPDLCTDFVLINPLGAPRSPATPGPYGPSSRLFRNPLYLGVERVPERHALSGSELEEFAELTRIGRGLTRDALIDREAVVDVKDRALRLCYSALDLVPGRREQFAHWIDRNPSALRFGAFRVLQSHLGDDWRQWPSQFQRPDDRETEQFASRHLHEVLYHAWLQWLLETQLAEVPRVEVGLIDDFPIGVAPAGFDTWSLQDQVASGVTVGAPPDAYALAGQNWGLSVLAPARLARSGYTAFIASIRASLHGMGGLRVDHVMGLFRTFLIPRGAEPVEGTYVRYPAEDLLGILALESHRAAALIVGEDLGNVEPGVRQRLAASNVLSSRILWFERDPADDALPRRAQDYPRLAMAQVGTHDLPTVAGLVSEADVHHQSGLGLIPPDRLEETLHRARALRDSLVALMRDEGLLPGAADEVGAIVDALHAFLGRTPAMLIALRLEDVLEVRERINLPTTTTAQRPQNWSMRLPLSLEAMRDHPRVRRINQTR